MSEERIWVDKDGARRDRNRNNAALCNGTSRRTKMPCMAIARANGKCKTHGGNNKGPVTEEGKARALANLRPKKLTTGECAPIWFDTLTEDEQDLYELIPSDAAVLLTEEIGLTTIRERRMMSMIQELKEGKVETTVEKMYKRRLKRQRDGEEIIEEERDDGSIVKATELLMESQVVRTEALDTRIQNIEEALTRVQNHKAKLIELRDKLEKDNIKQTDGSLDQLVSIIGRARQERESRDKGKQ